MKRTKNQRFLKLSFFATLMLSAFACNVREPGCLDIEADNFDVAAERHDSTLCTYPDLVLSVQYGWADSILQTNYLYQNAHGMHYAIHGVQLLFSNFIVMHNDGPYVIEERIELPLGACNNISPLTVPDDFVFVDRTAFNYTIGTFRKSGVIENAMLTLGIPEDYTPMCIDSLPANHRLKGSRAGYDATLEDFALARFIVSLDSTNASRDTFFSYGSPEKRQFDIGRNFRQGRHDTLFMSVDFHAIFDPVNLAQDPAVVASELGSRIWPAIMVW